jgi:hypothetical protein
LLFFLLLNLLLGLGPEGLGGFRFFLELLLLWEVFFLLRGVGFLGLVIKPIEFIEILRCQFAGSDLWRFIVVQNTEHIGCSLVVLLFHFARPFPVLFRELPDSFHFLFLLFFLLLDLLIFVLNVFLKVLEPLFMSVKDLEPGLFGLVCHMMDLLPGRDET